MSIRNSRWPAFVLAGALVLAGVASVAYAAGMASREPAAQAAQPTAIPGHPELGSGWTAPQAMRGFGGFGGQVAISITITGIDGTKLSLRTTDGWTRTIDVAGATVTRAGQTIGASGLKVGDVINFREARESDGSYKITTVSVVVPTVSGAVTAVTSTSVTIKQGDGTSKTLSLTGSTTYKQGGSTVGQSAVVVGARITAQGSVDSSGNFTALTVTIAPSTVQGTVTSKTANAIVVKTAAGKSVTVNVTAATKYTVRGVKSATLANVAVGNRISAQGSLNADGSITATAVQASPNDQPGFGGGGLGGGRGRAFPGFPGPGSSGPTANPSAAPSGANL